MGGAVGNPRTHTVAGWVGGFLEGGWVGGAVGNPRTHTVAGYEDRPKASGFKIGGSRNGPRLPALKSVALGTVQGFRL